MQSIGPQDAFLYQSNNFFDSQDTPKPFSDNGTLMWEYLNEGSIRGIPVEPQAQGLSVSSAQDLQEALALQTDINVWTGYISPQEQDKTSLTQYQAIKNQELKGSFIIFSQQREFCPHQGKFLMLVIYGKMSYKLNPRFKYLKEV